MLRSSVTLIVFVVNDDISLRKSPYAPIRHAADQVETFASTRGFFDRAPSCLIVGAVNAPQSQSNLADEESYDCLITDIHMPGVSRLDFKRLPAERGSRTPIIMITAPAEPDLETRAAAAGVAFLLRKPFEVDCLERALKA
jgi:FixJ family two-component response regulator